jgi:hypothetical protein
MKELIVIEKQEEREIAYLENGNLREYYTEKEDKNTYTVDKQKINARKNYKNHEILFVKSILSN